MIMVSIEYTCTTKLTGFLETGKSKGGQGKFEEFALKEKKGGGSDFWRIL